MQIVIYTLMVTFESMPWGFGFGVLLGRVTAKDSVEIRTVEKIVEVRVPEYIEVEKIVEVRIPEFLEIEKIVEVMVPADVESPPASSASAPSRRVLLILA